MCLWQPISCARSGLPMNKNMAAELRPGTARQPVRRGKLDDSWPSWELQVCFFRDRLLECLPEEGTGELWFLSESALCYRVPLATATRHSLSQKYELLQCVLLGNNFLNIAV